MTPAARLDIVIDQGTAWRRKLILKTSAEEDAPRINLTGWEIKAQLREDWDKPLLKEFEVEAEDLAQGEFWLILSDVDRSLWNFALKWDLLLTAPGSTPEKYVEGKVTVKSTITRTNA